MSEVVEFSLIFCPENLVFIMFHSHLVSELTKSGEEFFTLFLLNLEFAIFNVEVENSPNIMWLKLWNEFTVSISGNIRNITIL
jgi:hypothetical protein